MSVTQSVPLWSVIRLNAMLSVIIAEGHNYVHYAECRYAECRSAVNRLVNIVASLVNEVYQKC